MRKNDLLFISASCVLFVLIWIGFSLYHAHTTTTITDTQQVQVNPINPHFNRKAIDDLKTRTRVEPLLDETAPKAASASAQQPQITPTGAASASASATGGVRP